MLSGIFQLTRSRGAWRCNVATLKFICYFNSHAHVERDNYFNVCKKFLIISTHTLTWSVTVSKNLWECGILFQLTRSRGAWRPCSRIFQRYIKFQLTRSRGAWQFFLYNTDTEEKFQLTRSRGAWHNVVFAMYLLSYISTHTLTWSVTWFEIIYIWRKYFNSHAHVERDLTLPL